MEYTTGTPNLKATKIAAFDLDDTIIKTKSGKTFPKYLDDWELLNNKVAPKIQELHKSDHLIMIISNKKSISSGKMTISEFETKLEGIYTALNDTPFICFYSTGNDIYRKPRTGIWDDYVLSRPTGAQKVNLTKSFYCGDAAGRPTDFADTDYKFALNTGLPFKLPLQIFGDFSDKATLSLPMPLPPSTFLLEGSYDMSFLHEYAEQTMIVMTGSQASGKSTITGKIHRDGFEIVSQDLLKTPAKCRKALKTFLAKGDNVVIDNTNPASSNRKVWIDIAKELGVPHIVSIHVTTPKPIALHLSTYRNFYDTTKDVMKNKVPDVAIHTYFKRFEPPTKAEGFTAIHELSFCLDPKSDNTRVLQYMR